MAVDGGLAEQRTAQVELLDDAERAQIEELAHGARDRRVRNLAGAERIDADRDRLHDSDRVRDLHLAARRQPGGDDILGDVACAVGARAVHLRRVFAREAAAPVAGANALGGDPDLSPGPARLPAPPARPQAAGPGCESAEYRGSPVGPAGEGRSQP